LGYKRYLIDFIDFMPRGGYYPNAHGKKGMKWKKTLEKEALRKIVFDFVCKNMNPVLQGLLERSLGVQVRKIDSDGKEKIYDLPPDPQAAKTLIEHAIGKAPQTFEAPDGGEGDMLVGVVLFPSNKDAK